MDGQCAFYAMANTNVVVEKLIVVLAKVTTHISLRRQSSTVASSIY